MIALRRTLAPAIAMALAAAAAASIWRGAATRLEQPSVPSPGWDAEFAGARPLLARGQVLGIISVGRSDLAQMRAMGASYALAPVHVELDNGKYPVVLVEGPDDESVLTAARAASLTPFASLGGHRILARRVLP